MVPNTLRYLLVIGSLLAQEQYLSLGQQSIYLDFVLLESWAKSLIYILVEHCLAVHRL
jgi:hypothetical protein